jgi:transcriptional regulator with XRE-family HTH domain
MTVHETWRNVGSKIRHLRKSNGLTLKQLARGCDLSANTISLVERSEVAPNVDTLCKIATALGVSPSSLFLEVCKPRVVLQRADESGGETNVAGQTLQVLATAPQERGCMQVAQKAPLTEALADRRHSILCLSGQVELELDGQTYSLNPGDSLAFNSDAFHRWRNTGNATGIAVLVLPPTSYQELQAGN